jgi:hypothetical protein
LLRPLHHELLAVDDRVVIAYTLNLHRRDGSQVRMAVMAIWTVADGPVTARARWTRRRAEEPSARRRLQASLRPPTPMQEPEEEA